MNKITCTNFSNFTGSGVGNNNSMESFQTLKEFVTHWTQKVRWGGRCYGKSCFCVNAAWATKIIEGRDLTLYLKDVQPTVYTMYSDEKSL